MYGTQGIFSFTFELYPTEQVSSHADHEPPDEVIAAQTARNRKALLYLIDMAACPYAAIGKAATYCKVSEADPQSSSPRSWARARSRGSIELGW